MNMQQLAQNAGRKNQQIIADEFYIYTTGRLAGIAAAGVAVANIAVQVDSDFLIEKLSFNADIAGAAQTESSRVLPNIQILLTNTGSGRQLMSSQFPLTGLFGSGELPMILPRQYLLPASSTLQIALTSFEAAITVLLTLNFIGRKIYWGPAA